MRTGMSYQNAFHHAAMNHPISVTRMLNMQFLILQMKFILALDEVKRNPDLIMQKDERFCLFSTTHTLTLL